MKRREFITQTASAGVILAAGSVLSANPKKLSPPAKGKIPVAFTLSEGATVIDFAGPWEVFQDVMIPTRGSNHDDQMPFELYTVAETTEPLRGSAGLRLVPDYSFESAPQLKVIVVPAQQGGKALHAWLRKMSASTDIIMSVCTGAFQLGRAGLLTGKSATTHHDFFDDFVRAFPDVTLKRGLRFVEEERISTAGGLSSGIDLALRVVDRYFGRMVSGEAEWDPPGRWKPFQVNLETSEAIKEVKGQGQ